MKDYFTEPMRAFWSRRKLRVREGARPKYRVPATVMQRTSVAVRGKRTGAMAASGFGSGMEMTMTRRGEEEAAVKLVTGMRVGRQMRLERMAGGEKEKLPKKTGVEGR